MDLGELAADLLSELTNLLEEQGITLPPVIYIAPGNEVPFDCEQLTVHLTRIVSQFQGGDSPFPLPHALLMNSAEFWITLVRCVPTMDDQGHIDFQAMSVAAQQIMNDSRGIRRGLELIEQRHLLVPRNVPVTIGSVNTIGPSGGFAASSCSYTVQLVDIDMWAWDTPPGQNERIKEFK